MKTVFPEVPTELRSRFLEPPSGRVRVVIDTDAANEIDDQFAITWALQSPDRLEIEAVIAEPYSFRHLRDGLLEAAALIDSEPRMTAAESASVDSYRSWALELREAGIDPRQLDLVGPAEGMQLSYEEILRVFERTGVVSEGKVFRGSDGYLPSLDEPLDSPGVERLIELAMAPGDDPLYVVAIGCVTNVASAILKVPEIIKRIVVLWTSGYPTWCPRPNSPSLNFVQDVAASRLLFDSGVPLVYFPGYYIGAQLRLSLPEMERWVRGRGAVGDYLHHIYINNPIYARRGIRDQFGRTSVIWDMITLAWLIEPAWVPTTMVSTPTLDERLCWIPAPGPARQMLEAHGIDRDAIFRDFFRKLERASR